MYLVVQLWGFRLDAEPRPDHALDGVLAGLTHLLGGQAASGQAIEQGGVLLLREERGGISHAADADVTAS